MLVLAMQVPLFTQMQARLERKGNNAANVWSKNYLAQLPDNMLKCTIHIYV